jgi:hypothetical protein
MILTPTYHEVLRRLAEIFNGLSVVKLCVLDIIHFPVFIEKTHFAGAGIA